MAGDAPVPPAVHGPEGAGRAEHGPRAAPVTLPPQLPPPAAAAAAAGIDLIGFSVVCGGRDRAGIRLNTMRRKGRINELRVVVGRPLG